MSDSTSIKNLTISDLIFVNSSFFNIVFPIVLVLFVRFVPQANHIIFSNLKEISSLSTSLLVSLYSLFTLFIYFSQESRFALTCEKSELSLIFRRVNYIIIFIPIIIWLITIFMNESKHSSISIILMLLFVGFTIFLMSDIKKRKVFIQSPFAYLVYLAATAMIFYGALSFNDFSEGKYFYLISYGILFLFLGIIITLLYLIDSEMFNSGASKLISLGILLCFVILLKIGFKTIYTPVNIFLLYFLALRIILFLISRSVLILNDLFTNNKSFSNKLRFHDLKLIKDIKLIRKTRTERILVIFFVLTILTIIICTKNRNQHDFETINSPNSRVDFDQYVENWLNKDSTTAPIYLITGQGGGSRAGSVFFQTISELDTILNNNLLSINTISGSGTGAQFYLSAKYQINNQFSTLFNNSNIIKKANMILYQRDYISCSLFKIFFSDYIRSIFTSASSKHSRNAILMQQESDAYSELKDSFNLDIIGLNKETILDSTWSSVYSDAIQHKNKFPLFFPTSYNISYALKAISSPVKLSNLIMSPFFDILESIGDKRNLKIIQSVALNQMFPIMSASPALDSFNYMDGGVYDNMGFETLFDLYRSLTIQRDRISPQRKIILISIENGAYEPVVTKRKSFDLEAVINSVTGSIFSAVPIEHKNEGIKNLFCKDTFFQIRVFVESVKSEPSFKKFFKYIPNENDVIMSRYLTKREIDTIASRSSFEVSKFKQKLDQFLRRSSDSLYQNCIPRIIVADVDDQTNSKKINHKSAENKTKAK